MMIKPGITELSRCVDSRYTLVTMAAKRARMIGEHTEEKNGEFRANKPVSIAANEIAEGKIGYVRSEAIKAAEEYEAEKAAAILSYNDCVFEGNANETEGAYEGVSENDAEQETDGYEPQEADSVPDESESYSEDIGEDVQ